MIADTDIMPVKAGVYGSVNGARGAAKYRKAARVAASQAAVANGYLGDAEMQAALAALGTDEPQAPPLPTKVTRARFGGLQPKRKSSPAADEAPKGATLEMLENFDRNRGLDWSRYGG